MSLRRLKPQNMELVKRNQRELDFVINNNFGGLPDDLKGLIASAIIEFVIASGGDTDVLIHGETIPNLDEED